MVFVFFNKSIVNFAKIKIKASYRLALSILDLRILLQDKFEISEECFIFFVDCLFATLEMLFIDSNDQSLNENLNNL